MPHNLDLILTLTGGLAAALAFGLFTQRLKLSPIVGYLLAGVAVGPFTPGFVAHANIAEQLAELGVILLMFGVGLHFHVKELMAVRRVAIPGAIVQIGVAAGLAVVITQVFDFSLAAGVVFGLAISVASTVVLLRVLSDNDALHTRAGHVAVGWLLVEDLFTVLVLVMLPVVAGDQRGEGVVAIATAIGIAVAKIVALVVFTMLAGKHLIPRLLDRVARTRSRELFTLTVLVLALGIAVGSAKLFGASMALGAFLAGMVVGQSEFATRAASEALPMRDAFAVIFFVSMGMLFDPGLVVANLGLTLATLAIVLIGKPLAAIAVVLVLGDTTRTAIAVAIALAQIGEFSFILAALGRQLGVLPAEATQALVVAAIVSITLNPLLYRLVEPITRWLRRKPDARTEGAAAADLSADAEHRAIIVGHGPIGRTLTELLGRQGVTPTVIELNHDTVRDLLARGVHALYGDASQREVLEQAGIATAKSFIFTASGSPDAAIRQAKAIRPDLAVTTRAALVSETASLKAAGAETVVVAEREVALAMAERILRDLGATDEQLDRARDRVRSELAPAQ